MRFKNLLPLSLLLPSIFSLSLTDQGGEPDPVCRGIDGPSAECLCQYVDLERTCYPKLFQPTEEFQVVHPDQELPSGLHVKVNLETGLKEAKLYDGQDDKSLNAVEVFSSEVEETVPDSNASSAEAFPTLNFGQGGAQQLLKPNEGHGPIRPPLPNSEDGIAFTTSLKTLVSSSESSSNEDALLPALSTLEDIAHDISYGLELSKDSAAIHKLNNFIATTSTSVQLKSAAALLLGTAIQNNPAALSAALTHFYNDEYPSGLLETVLFALVHEQVPALLSRLVYLLSELCQDQGQLIKFIRADGLDLLRVIYNAHNATKGRDAVKSVAKQKLDAQSEDHMGTRLKDADSSTRYLEVLIDVTKQWAKQIADFIPERVYQNMSPFVRDAIGSMINAALPHRNPDAAQDRLKQKISNFVLDHFLMEDSLQGISRSPRPKKTQSETLGKLTAPLSKPKLEDSPWILLDTPDTSFLASAPNGSPQDDSPQDPKNIASALHPWCTSLSSSLESWKNTVMSTQEKATAQEHVEEAYGALKKQLERYGCSCEDKKKCE
ncbi:hypothetical protein MMC10_000613 [Thelotrema lepadinum]|nr:hypothetical protein [Thelotrema lepadinum]